MQDAYFVRNDVSEYPNMEHMLNDCIINRNSCDNIFLPPYIKIICQCMNVLRDHHNSCDVKIYEWSLGLHMLDYFN